MSDELERIAVAFEQIAKVLAQFYDKMYPPKHEPGDVTLSRVKSDLDRIKEAQGSAPGESTEEWLDIGPREREYLAGAQARESRRPARPEKKRSRA